MRGIKRITVDVMKNEVITMAHGSGGAGSAELMERVFSRHFGNEILGRLEDSAVVDAASRLAISTDSFVVTPLIFPGGDIGKLAVCGTVNDVLMSGAEPRFLTCGLILETGLPIALLDDICASLAKTAAEAGVTIIAGDTKVIEGRGEGGGLIINTTGIGVISSGDCGVLDFDSAQTGDPLRFDSAQPYETEPGRGKKNQAGFAMQISEEPGLLAERAGSPQSLPSPAGICPGDAILVSGNLGDHHAAILSARMGIENSIQSDCALLTPIILALREAGVAIHAMRDVTRGGLATVLNELATASGLSIELEEGRIPVDPEVKAFCGIMGLDPLYMGNEGKLVLAVAPEDAERALTAIRGTEIGRAAAIIGTAAKSHNIALADTKRVTPSVAKGTAPGTDAEDSSLCAFDTKGIYPSVLLSDAKGASPGVLKSTTSRVDSEETPPGTDTEDTTPGVASHPTVTMRTRIGGTVRLDVLYGEGLPRIC